MEYGDQAGRCRSNTLEFYLAGAVFESRPEHWLS
jgi:hypothetical protein